MTTYKYKCLNPDCKAFKMLFTRLIEQDCCTFCYQPTLRLVKVVESIKKPVRAVKKKKPVKKTTAQIIKKLKGILDKLWSLAVRDVGYCEKCGKTGSLQAHHIYSRTRLATRWDLNNGLCLCPNCHLFRGAHATQYDLQRAYHHWLVGYKGSEFLENLEQKSNTTYKPTISDLEQIIKDLEGR